MGARSIEARNVAIGGVDRGVLSVQCDTGKVGMLPIRLRAVRCDDFQA